MRRSRGGWRAAWSAACACAERVSWRALSRCRRGTADCLLPPMAVRYALCETALAARVMHIWSFLRSSSSLPNVRPGRKRIENSHALSPATRSHAPATLRLPLWDTSRLYTPHLLAHTWPRWPPSSAALVRSPLREGHSRLPRPAWPACSGTETTQRLSPTPFQNTLMVLQQSTNSLAAVSTASSAFASATTSRSRARTRAGDHGALTSR